MKAQDRLIVSVPHSGTRFLKSRFGWRDHRHTITSYERLISDIEAWDHKIIIPLRHPQDVLRSWFSRQKHRQTYWLTQFVMAWTHLQHVHDACDSEVVTIEGQDHFEITDWTPVGDTDKKYDNCVEKADYIDITPIFALPIIQQRYKPRLVKHKRFKST